MTQTSSLVLLPVDCGFGYAQRALLTSAALGVNGLVLFSAVVAALTAEQEPDLYFAEGSFITVWSSLQMIAIGAICLWIFHMRRDAMASPRRHANVLWLMAAIGACALSIDEAAGIHEAIDHHIHATFMMPENPWTDRLDDVIVFGYGLIALATAYVCRAELVLIRPVKNVFITAFALFFTMVACDLLTNSYSISARDEAQLAQFDRLRAWGVVIEESFKMASEGVFIAAFAIVALICQRKSALDDSR